MTDEAAPKIEKKKPGGFDLETCFRRKSLDSVGALPFFKPWLDPGHCALSLYGSKGKIRLGPRFTYTLSTENRKTGSHETKQSGDGGGERAGSMMFGRSKSSSSTTPSSTPAASTAAAACSKVRAAYHDCFNRWYAEKFAKGQWQRDDCADHWRKYRACLEVTHPSLPLSRLLYSYARLDSTGVTNLSVVNKDPIFVFPTFCSKDTVLECRVLELGISRLCLWRRVCMIALVYVRV
jgi:hypothetical protein